RGSLVKGWTCSARTPENSALSATHWSVFSALLKSSGLLAQAMSYWASHIVQMNQGLPGTFAMSCDTWWEYSSSYLATPPTLVFTHKRSRIDFMVATTFGSCGANAPKAKIP